MALAQKLFEKGLITYHRTDSNALSVEFLNEVEAFLKKNNGIKKENIKQEIKVKQKHTKL